MRKSGTAIVALSPREIAGEESPDRDTAEKAIAITLAIGPDYPIAVGSTIETTTAKKGNRYRPINSSEISRSYLQPAKTDRVNRIRDGRDTGDGRRIPSALAIGYAARQVLLATDIDAQQGWTGPTTHGPLARLARARTRFQARWEQDCQPLVGKLPTYRVHTPQSAVPSWHIADIRRGSRGLESPEIDRAIAGLNRAFLAAPTAKARKAVILQGRAFAHRHGLPREMVLSAIRAGSRSGGKNG